MITWLALECWRTHSHTLDPHRAFLHNVPTPDLAWGRVPRALCWIPATAVTKCHGLCGSEQQVFIVARSGGKSLRSRCQEGRLSCWKLEGASPQPPQAPRGLGSSSVLLGLSKPHFDLCAQSGCSSLGASLCPDVPVHLRTPVTGFGTHPDLV